MAKGNLTKVLKEGKEYHSLQSFMLAHGIRSPKTVYNWVLAGNAEMLKIGPASFFRKK